MEIATAISIIFIVFGALGGSIFNNFTSNFVHFTRKSTSQKNLLYNALTDREQIVSYPKVRV
jgi:hypothetical protein